MQITKATIRTTEKYVLIDATVDGKLCDGFVLYDGNTRDHEDAALIYLVNSVKLSISAIDFVDDRKPSTDGYEVDELDVEDWRPDPIYASQFAHASGYHD